MTTRVSPARGSSSRRRTGSERAGTTCASRSSRSIAYAERAGNRSMELEALVHDLAAVAFGSTPVDEGIRVARQVLEDVSDSRELQGWAIRFIGTFLALEGRVAEGRELLEQARAIFTELGNGEALVALAFSMGPLELRAGNAVAAEGEFRTALESAQRMGDRGRLTNLASGLADALLDQGRIDDAAEYVDLARDTAVKDDASGQGAWRMAAARLLLGRGETGEAIRLARESISFMESNQELLTLPDLVLRQAEVFQGAGLDEDAETCVSRSHRPLRTEGIVGRSAASAQPPRHDGSGVDERLGSVGRPWALPECGSRPSPMVDQDCSGANRRGCRQACAARRVTSSMIVASLAGRDRQAGQSAPPTRSHRHDHRAGVAYPTLSRVRARVRDRRWCAFARW